MISGATACSYCQSGSFSTSSSESNANFFLVRNGAREKHVLMSFDLDRVKDCTAYSKNQDDGCLLKLQAFPAARPVLLASIQVIRFNNVAVNACAI